MGMWIFLLALMFVNIFFGIERAWFTAMLIDVLAQIAITIQIGTSLRGEYQDH
ncbi:hypothetical protein [Acetobacter sp.]|uniref:hypothetical protein n=1 Tax=Acetobacter sp. TaxID=440 RepID=UPI0039EA8C88